MNPTPFPLPLGSPAAPINAVAEDKPAIALNPTASAGSGADADYRAKATDAAIKFEGFFIANMLHKMRSGTRELAGQDSVFKDKANGDMLDMADTLVAEKMAGQRAFGIADAILRQLLPPVGKPETIINNENIGAGADTGMETTAATAIPRATE
ncbi:hypothetical protein ACO0LO_17515 [Undibacterium sp. TJN25]|uniref:hypothetical protein n=1 Tax=Undibacterium sp. TJN25 TaxID=3413056 RepID=UPI003BEF5182